MSKRTELGVFERTIAIPGVRVTRTGMRFERVDEETLCAAGAFLQAVDGCAAWWWGDYLAEYCGYELRAEEDEHGQLDEITRGDRLKQYTNKYAAIAGKEPKTLWQYLWISRFYDSSCRQEELTWTHHVEATVGADGDLAKAQEWLDLAKLKSWSAADLRGAIRKTKRSALDEQDGPAAQSLLPMELIACRRYASAKLPSVVDMDLAAAKAQLAELQPVLAYATALLQRIGVGVAKESLSVAA